MLFEGSDRTARFPLINFFAGPIAKIAHSLGVGARPIGLALDQSGAAAIPRAFHRFPGSFRYGEHVISVRLHSWQTVGRSAPGHGGISGGILERNFRCELIILTYKKHR